MVWQASRVVCRANKVDDHSQRPTRSALFFFYDGIPSSNVLDATQPLVLDPRDGADNPEFGYTSRPFLTLYVHERDLRSCKPSVQGRLFGLSDQ